MRRRAARRPVEASGVDSETSSIAVAAPKGVVPAPDEAVTPGPRPRSATAPMTSSEASNRRCGARFVLGGSCAAVTTVHLRLAHTAGDVTRRNAHPVPPMSVPPANRVARPQVQGCRVLGPIVARSSSPPSKNARPNVMSAPAVETMPPSGQRHDGARRVRRPAPRARRTSTRSAATRAPRTSTDREVLTGHRPPPRARTVSVSCQASVTDSLVRRSSLTSKEMR